MTRVPQLAVTAACCGLILGALAWSAGTTNDAAPPFASALAPSQNLLDRKSAILGTVNKDYARLDAFYKQLHANPELSLEEEKTAARLAIELKVAGLDVTEKVGGHGVVGVLSNGKGPTVLVRADMDALPITEKTGVPYASRVRVRDKEGRDVGVMHACGHDINVTCLVGTAPPQRVAAAKKPGGPPLPAVHTAEYFPIPEPTVKTGVLTMSMAVLELMGK